MEEFGPQKKNFYKKATKTNIDEIKISAIDGKQLLTKSNVHMMKYILRYKNTYHQMKVISMQYGNRLRNAYNIKLFHILWKQQS